MILLLQMFILVKKDVMSEIFKQGTADVIPALKSVLQY